MLAVAPSGDHNCKVSQSLHILNTRLMKTRGRHNYIKTSINDPLSSKNLGCYVVKEQESQLLNVSNTVDGTTNTPSTIRSCGVTLPCHSHLQFTGLTLLYQSRYDLCLMPSVDTTRRDIFSLCKPQSRTSRYRSDHVSGGECPLTDWCVTQ